MGMFDDLRIHRTLLNADLKYAPFYSDSFWTRFMGFIGAGSDNYPKSVALGSSETRSLTPTGKPIEVLTDFMAEGSDSMDIPLLNPLTNQPLYDTQLLNNEEESKLSYLEAYLHIYRFGTIVQDSKMGVQKNPKKLTKLLMSKAQSQLKDYARRLIGYQPYLALLEKFSDNLTASTAVGGGGATIVLHPNFYVAGTTRPTWSATPATYATNISNALATLTDTAAKRMSADMIKSMVRQASALKIRPATKINGKLLYDIVLSEAGAFDLSKDNEFRTAMNYAYMGAQEKARLEYGQLDGMVFFNAIIHIDQNMPDAKISGDTGWDSTKTVSFGNTTYMANPLSTGNKKLAILFGASAVACAYAKPLSFEQETWDYKSKVTEGADLIIGFERADIMDRDAKFAATAAFKENASSFVVAHWGDDVVTSF